MLHHLAHIAAEPELSEQSEEVVDVRAILGVGRRAQIADQA
jgi:hypothetical protein